MLLLLRFCSVENSVLTSAEEASAATAAAAAVASAAASTRGTARLGVRRAAAAVKIIWFTRTGAAAAQQR